MTELMTVRRVWTRVGSWTVIVRDAAGQDHVLRTSNETLAAQCEASERNGHPAEAPPVLITHEGARILKVEAA